MTLPGIRMEDQPASGCGVVLLAAVSLVSTRHSQRLPGSSQYVGPALCHAGFRRTGLDGYGDGPPATATATAT